MTLQKLTYLFSTALTLLVPILANSAAKTVPLSTDEELQWINTVKTHKTADGKTVMEVLTGPDRLTASVIDVLSELIYYINRPLALRAWLAD